MKTKNRIWIYHLMIMGILLMLSNNCSKEKNQGPGEAPVLTTVSVNSVTPTTANCGGSITSDGGAKVTARGLCWSATQNPTTDDNKTTDGSGTGTFTSAITDLTANTAYYVRAYATNSVATSYGNELLFKTFAGTVSDFDGNVYYTVTIGTQTWMAENLKTTRYGNGDLIGTTIPATLDITGESAPEYQWAYDDNEGNVLMYGRLYSWYAVSDSRSISPVGWHVPSDVELATLISYLGSGSAGAKIRETGTSHWSGPNSGATNETDFTALPSGMRYANGTFDEIGRYGNWWCSVEHSAAEANFFGVGSIEGYIYGGYYTKANAYAVRCLKD
jgi:uncharacterized protein (TIGR02145 family)